MIGAKRLVGCGIAIALAGMLSATSLEAQVQNPPQRQIVRQRQMARRLQVQRLRIQRQTALRCARMAFRGIGLNEQQRQQMRELRQQRQPELRVLAQKVRQAQRAVRAERQATPINEAATQQQREQIRKLRQEITATRRALRSDLIKLLTPAQQQKLRARARRLAIPRGQGATAGSATCP